MELLMVHRLRKNETLEMLSAYYRVPVCMIIRANPDIAPKDMVAPRELKIPKKSACNKCVPGTVCSPVTQQEQ